MQKAALPAGEGGNSSATPATQTTAAPVAKTQWQLEKEERERIAAERIRKLVGQIRPLAQRARDAFDFNALKRICEMETPAFSDYAKEYTNGQQSFWFADNGSDILAVCHLDSVVKSSRKTVFADTAFGNTVFSPVLDDRLGAYIILEWLPKLGMKFDWLLCDDEETGRTSAKITRLSKTYKWMVEFDRKGEDVVMYQYETPEYKTLLEDCGWEVGTGSYSDISALSSLACMGFNVGVSYHDYHSIKAYANIDDLIWTMGKFQLFYQRHKDTHFPHDPSVTTRRYGGTYYGNGYNYNGTGYANGHNNRSMAGDEYDDYNDWYYNKYQKEQKQEGKKNTGKNKKPASGNGANTDVVTPDLSNMSKAFDESSGLSNKSIHQFQVAWMRERTLKTTENGRLTFGSDEADCYALYLIDKAEALDWKRNQPNAADHEAMLQYAHWRRVQHEFETMGRSMVDWANDGETTDAVIDTYAQYALPDVLSDGEEENESGLLQNWAEDSRPAMG